MKILAGGRGSGKTHQLIHMAAECGDGYYACNTHELARHLRKKYRDVLPEDRILTYDQLDDSRGRPWRYGTIFIDSLRSGDTLPAEWYEFKIGAIAVEGDSTFSNPHLSDTYKQHILELGFRDVQKDE